MSQTASAAGIPPRVIVLGSINVDLVVRTERLPAPGETVLGGSFFQASGGKGANQAVAAARLGRQPVIFVAAVGDDDFGRAALGHLSREPQLDLRYVRTERSEPTGVALIHVDNAGQNSISVASGANATLSSFSVHTVPDDEWRCALVVLVSLEASLTAVGAALNRARSFDQLTIVNPAPADPHFSHRVWLEQIDVLTPNEHEATQLSGVEVVDATTAIAAARELQSRGARHVIVTLGSKGCVVVPQTGKPTVLKVPPVAAVDTTAAGDQFSGALAVALSERKSLIEAADWANRAAAISVTRLGAQPSLAFRSELDAVE